MKTALPVIRLLNLLRAIRELAPFDALDADEELLLNDVILRWHVQDRLTVKEVMDDARYPSKTTAYRRLIRLKDKGLVILETAKHDARIKYVCPTEASSDYVARLENGVEQIARGQ
jgi:DNA-binding MarR family transcriptional regulator